MRRALLGGSALVLFCIGACSKFSSTGSPVLPDAGADSSVGTSGDASTFCAAIDAAFCEDFDRDDIDFTEGWSLSLTHGDASVMTTDAQSYSAPSSLRAELLANDDLSQFLGADGGDGGLTLMENATAYIEKAIAHGTIDAVSVDLYFWLDAFESDANAESRMLRVTDQSGNSVEVTLDIVGGRVQIAAVVQTVDNVATPYLVPAGELPVSLGAWHHLVFDAIYGDASAGVSRYQLTLNGQLPVTPVSTSQASPPPPPKGGANVDFGFGTQTPSTYGLIYYDDLVVQFHP